MNHALVTLLFAAMLTLLGVSGCSTQTPESQTPTVVDKAKQLQPITPGSPGKKKGPEPKAT